MEFDKIHYVHGGPPPLILIINENEIEGHLRQV